MNRHTLTYSFALLATTIAAPVMAAEDYISVFIGQSLDQFGAVKRADEPNISPDDISNGGHPIQGYWQDGSKDLQIAVGTRFDSGFFTELALKYQKPKIVSEGSVWGTFLEDGISPG